MTRLRIEPTTSQSWSGCSTEPLCWLPMLWYSLEAPHWGASNEHRQHKFSWRNKKTYIGYSLEASQCFHEEIWKISYLDLIVLGFNDTSTLEGHFVSSPREREKRDRRESRGDEREGQGRKRNRNESEETEEIKTFPLYPYPLQG